MCAFALLLLEVKGRSEGGCSALANACGDCSYACALSKVRRLCSCVTGTSDVFSKLYVNKASSGYIILGTSLWEEDGKGKVRPRLEISGLGFVSNSL